MSQKASKVVFENWSKSSENHPHRLFLKQNIHQHSSCLQDLCDQKLELSENGQSGKSPSQNRPSENGPSEKRPSENGSTEKKAS